MIFDDPKFSSRQVFTLAPWFLCGPARGDSSRAAARTTKNRQKVMKQFRVKEQTGPKLPKTIKNLKISTFCLFPMFLVSFVGCDVGVEPRQQAGKPSPAVHKLKLQAWGRPQISREDLRVVIGFMMPPCLCKVAASQDSLDRDTDAISGGRPYSGPKPFSQQF